MTATPETFIGTWRLLSWVITDGEGKKTEPMGPAPWGLLTYAADGYMFAMLGADPSTRARFAGSDPLAGTPEEAQRAMSTCHSYCGRWRIDGDSLVHTVEGALWPNMVGTEQVRHYRFDGDRVILKTPPMTRKGASGIAELTWTRVKA